MAYFVNCECGKQHEVSAVQAGSTFECDCGLSVEVPLLSSLRREAGEEPIPLSTVERIRKMLAEELLPEGSTCPISGGNATHTILFHVQCEHAWTESNTGDYGTRLLYSLFLGWWVTLFFKRREEEVKEFGRDTSVVVPVRFAEEECGAVLKMRKSQELRELLSKTPIYAKLFEEFPDADVVPVEQV